MKYMTSGSAAADLFAAESGVIAPGEIAVVSTGETLPDLGAGLCGVVLPRSGLAAKFGITVLNSPGLIDPDYQGEIKVILINHGKEDFTYPVGMRIAQLAAIPYTRIWGIPTSGSNRGKDGLGSTGE